MAVCVLGHANMRCLWTVKAGPGASCLDSNWNQGECVFSFHPPFSVAGIRDPEPQGACGTRKHCRQETRFSLPSPYPFRTGTSREGQDTDLGLWPQSPPFLLSQVGLTGCICPSTKPSPPAGSGPTLHTHVHLHAHSPAGNTHACIPVHM